jgi:hypothetical protein
MSCCLVSFLVSIFSFGMSVSIFFTLLICILFPDFLIFFLVSFLGDSFFFSSLSVFFFGIPDSFLSIFFKSLLLLISSIGVFSLIILSKRFVCCHEIFCSSLFDFVNSFK